VSERLAGKVAVITGAGSGIGAATAELFAREGAHVVCADLSGREDEIAASIGSAALAVNVDVSRADQVARMVDVAEREFGGLDVLCNNAGFGGGTRALLADVDEAAFDAQIAVHLKGVFLGMKYGIPAMLRRGGGSIINTASAAGLVGMKEIAPYSAAKGGVVLLTKSAALDYADANIRINAICPGMTWTGLAGGGAGAATASEPPPGDHLPQPMKRWGRSSELAATALFLASDDASFITGAAIPVDGGFVAR
jgi:NAD(P)-dependent dehydrogenase (short-subunit alcohol dehydrogenase family)